MRQQQDSEEPDETSSRQELEDAADHLTEEMAERPPDSFADAADRMAELARYAIGRSSYDIELIARHIATTTRSVGVAQRLYVLTISTLDPIAPLVGPTGAGSSPDAQCDPDGMLLVVAAVLTYCRRKRFYSQQGVEIARAYSPEFSDRPIFAHLQALSLLDSSQPGHLEEGADRAQQALASFIALGEDPPAGTHHLIAKFCDRLVRQYADSDADRQVKLDEGLDQVQKAIVKNPTLGSFYSTRARLRIANGDFDEGRVDLEQAVRLEDHTAHDYHERVSEYLSLMVLVEAERRATEQEQRYETSIEEQRREFDAAKGKIADLERSMQRATQTFAGAQIRLIEVLAFFAAALALIQSGATLTRDRPASEALMLLGGIGVVLFGAVFLGSFMLKRSYRELRLPEDSREDPDSMSDL